MLPGSEASLLALAEHRGRFGPGDVVAVPELAVVERALDKRALAPLALRAGLAVPPTEEHVPGRPPSFGFPAVVKPFSSETRDAAGSLRRVLVRVAADAGELEAAVPRERARCCRRSSRARCARSTAWRGRAAWRPRFTSAASARGRRGRACSPTAARSPCSSTYRAAMRSWVRTVSLPISDAISPGSQDHWVPMADPVSGHGYHGE